MRYKRSTYECFKIAHELNDPLRRLFFYRTVKSKITLIFNILVIEVSDSLPELQRNITFLILGSCNREYSINLREYFSTDQLSLRSTNFNTFHLWIQNVRIPSLLLLINSQ